MTAASVLKQIVMKHGQKLGTMSGVGIFKSADSTFVLVPSYYWFDVFMLFPVNSLYVVKNDVIAKVMEEKISKLK
jgi:hypothetical protein